MITSNTNRAPSLRTGATTTTSSARRNPRNAWRPTAGFVRESGLWMGVAAFVVAGCTSAGPVAQNQAPPSSSLVGPPGPTGPVGPAGIQGETGETGAPGVALAGPRGATGPAGQPGERGAKGATGAAGAVEVGQAGRVGAAGPAGVQGERGAIGAQGASQAGYVGETGLPGPSGVQGERGETGLQGATLVGPTGPVGPRGSAGVQGEIGATGSQGSTTDGISGERGLGGEIGSPGEPGVAGDRGPTGLIGRWTSYRDFWFANDATIVRPSDQAKLAEVATYLNANPSLQLGIDIFVTADDQSLRDRRVEAVRDALVAAGVPAGRISAGSFGAADPRRAARVEVLIATAPTYTGLRQ